MICNRNQFGQRKCYSCNEWKNPAEFNKLTNSPDGLDYYCKQCKKEKNSKYYKEKTGQWKKEKQESRILFCKIKKDEFRQVVSQYKRKGCACCGETAFCCLDFHHIDPKEKDFNISYLQNGNGSKQQLINEIEKCIVVCANCHRKIHAGIIKCPSLTTQIDNKK